MAARISQRIALDSNPNNFLLPHAMGPNVARVIGSADGRRSIPLLGRLKGIQAGISQMEPTTLMRAPFWASPDYMGTR